MRLYTVVPVSKIKSIVKYGLLPNNMLSNIDGDFERVFDESEFGYIYASTTLKNSCDWSRFINPQVDDDCIILTYDVDEELVEYDMCSPNNFHCDVRFFNKVIPSECISAIALDVYRNGYVDFGSLKESLDLTKYSNIDEFINEYKITFVSGDSYKVMDRINKYGKNDVYVVIMPRVLQMIEMKGKLSWNLVSMLNITQEEALNLSRRYGEYIYATYYYENAIGLYDTVLNLAGEATLLRVSVHGRNISLNNIGINKLFCDLKISGSIPLSDIKILNQSYN